MQETSGESYSNEQALAAFATNLRDDLNALTKIKPEPLSIETFTDYFVGTNLPSSWRESELVVLRDALLREKSGILVALETDLGVSAQEAEVIEFVPLIQELNHVISQHRKWFEQRLPVSVADFNPSLSDGAKVVNLPMGNVLILGQSGNELATLIRPLIYAIAAGNYSIVVPEKLGFGDTPTTLWTTLEFILRKQLSQERILIVDTEKEWQSLIDKKQVHMVVDGRKLGNKEIARKITAQNSIKYLPHGHLKNIAIVDKHADLSDAGRQIGAHKFYKAGQDYNNLDVVYVHSSVQEKFTAELKNALFWHRGHRGPMQFQHGKLLDKDTFKEIKETIKNREGKHGELLTSIFTNIDTMQINPALFLNPSAESKILNAKNQNPILPVVTFDDLPELLVELSQKETSNNLYFFTDKKFLFEEAKSLLPARNLFFNCTGFYLKSSLTPNYASNWMPSSSLQGISAFHTFSRQKVFTWDNASKFSIANSSLL
jgi:aldehyde dehydrogenase (NAD+)